MKRILKYIAIFASVLLLILITAPFLFKGKIINLIKKAANDNLNAVVDFDNNIQLSLIRNFPNFTLGINNLSVVGINDFQNDTLFAINKFTATLDIMSVLKGEQIKILAVVLNQPRINAKVLADGKANWDIAKPSTDTSTVEQSTDTVAAFNIKLKRFEIINADIVYDDRQSNMYASLVKFNHKLKGDFSQNEFLLSIQNTIEQLTLKMDGIAYLNKVNLVFNADMDANMQQMRFVFKQNEIQLNALKFVFDGWLQMPENDIEMDIRYDAPAADFKHFISLIPAIYAKDFNNLTAQGKLGFGGFVRGIYNEKSYPEFEFKINVENGMFKYPDLPAPVSNVQVDFLASNKTNSLDGIEVNLSKFHVELGNDPFDATFFAKNLMKDPTFNTALNGKIDLAGLSKIIPFDEGVKIAGIITTAIRAQGKLSTIENQKYDQFDASGMLKIDNLLYAAPDLSMPIAMNKMELNFTPKSVKMPVLDAKIGNSDFVLSGELTNFFAYILSDGTIKGNLSITSNLIDANQFLSEEDNTAQPENNASTDTTLIEAPVIPQNIDFKLAANIKKLKYTNMDITNFTGGVVVSGGKLSFKQVRLNTLGALIGLDGYYHALDAEKPETEMEFSIQNLDIQKAFVTFNTIQKLAPVAENMSGTFNAKFKMNTAFDKYLNPQYDDLFASGLLEIPNATLSGVKVFERTADLLKNDRFREPTMSNVRIQFSVEQGRVYTQPFDINIAGQKLTMSGSSGLDQTLDYIGKTIIPKSALGAVNTGANSLLNQLNKQAGTSVRMSENIPLDILIKGTFSDPKVSTTLAAAGKNEAENIRNQLVDEANKRKEELEAKARAEAERLKQEAQQKADQARSEAEAKARAEADRIKREAEENAKAEQERLRKQAEEEARRKLKGVIRP